MTDLNGKVALVTGASRGIGQALAVRLGRAGASVVCTARTNAELAELVTVIRAGGSRAVAVPADLRDRAAPDGVVAAAVEQFGRLDVLLNNAATFHRARFEDTTDDDWEEQIAVNLTATFRCTRAAVRQMLHQAPLDGVRGHILTVNSRGGVEGNPTGTAYSASKFGAMGLSASLRAGLRDRGIKVTDVVLAATVRTAMSADRDVAKLDPTEVAEPVVAALTTSRRAVVTRIDIEQVVLVGGRGAGAC